MSAAAKDALKSEQSDVNDLRPAATRTLTMLNVCESVKTTKH